MSKKSVHFTTLKLPKDLWLDLMKALKIRADRATQATGTEVKPTFVAWLRDKARETIEAYR